MGSRGGGHRDPVPLDCKVYVGELGNNGTRHELEEAFGYYGPLRNVWVARNPPGFAFIMFEEPRDARDAVRALDGKIICGKRVRVELSTGKSRREGGPGSGDGGSGGGGGGGGGRGGRGPPSGGYGGSGRGGERGYRGGSPRRYRSPSPVGRGGREGGRDAYPRGAGYEDRPARGGGGGGAGGGGRFRSRSPRSPRNYSSRRYSRSRSRSFSGSRSPSSRPRTPPNGAAP